MIPCYELIEVHLGDDIIYARPVEWDREDYDGQGNDIDGNPVEPTAYHATCPNCGNLVQFGLGDVFVAEDETENNVICQTCEFGKTPSKYLNAKIILDNGFIDPVRAGFIDTRQIDLEDLTKLDSILKEL